MNKIYKQEELEFSYKEITRIKSLIREEIEKLDTVYLDIYCRVGNEEEGEHIHKDKVLRILDYVV